MIICEDPYFYYARKPHGIPTSYGKGRCFLDELRVISSGAQPRSPAGRNPFLMGKEISPLRSTSVEMTQKEYGLVNRLDNDTAGLLYFAKTQEIYDEYKALQSEGKVIKTYYATVYGEVKPEFFWVKDPIGHSQSDPARMVVIDSIVGTPSRGVRHTGRLHYVETYVQKISYNKEKHQTLLEVQITKGIRHQIRVHLASVGYPIVGDKLYVNKKLRRILRQKDFFEEDTQLQLVSAGLKIL